MEEFAQLFLCWVVIQVHCNLQWDEPYPLQAQPGPWWQVLSSEIHESPQALLLPGVQCLQQAPLLGGDVGGTKTVGIGVRLAMMTVGARMIAGLRVAAAVGRLVAVLDGVSDGVLVAVFVRVGEAVSIDCSVGVSVIGVKVSVGLSVGESVAAFANARIYKA